MRRAIRGVGLQFGGMAVLALALAVAAAACGGGNNESSGANESLTVQFDELSGSGESGTATMTAVGDNQTKVVIDLSGAPSTPQPAHIHEGTCTNLNATPKYALNDVVNGKSTTTVSESLSDLEDEAHAINVHKSAKALKTYVACGSFGKAESAGGSSGGYPGY